MTADTIRRQFVDYLHERAREHYTTYLLVGHRYWDKMRFYIHARLCILERISEFEEWDEN